MLRNERVWKEHNEFKLDTSMYEGMLYIHYLDMGYKRTPSLTWIPYLEKKAVKYYLNQAT